MTKAEAARQKKEARMQAEIERVEQMRTFEREAVRRAGGAGLICGIDEAGRGPLAGPVAAAAVILPDDLVLPYLNDSKKVTEKRREMLYEQIKEKAVAWSVIMVPPDRIDEINILQATYEAMRQAVASLGVRPGVLINDAVTIPDVDILQVPVIKGDAKCISIAAASILAKVTRDAYMKEMDALYPVYGFAGHKGYGTKAHCDAILEHGPSPIHRRSFLGKILARTGGAGKTEQADPVSPDDFFSEQEFSKRETGMIGEEKAVRFLSEHGVKILERNFRDRDGEIDVIGEEDKTLVFFEVKYRSSGRWGDPAESVNPEKQRTICKTALYYLYKTRRGTEIPMRFDVISITDKEIRWIRNAFSFR